MFDVLRLRLSGGLKTIPFPPQDGGGLPARFRGRPAIAAGACADSCRACAEACPTDAIALNGGVKLDLGRCVFCVECTAACPEGAIRFTNDYRLAASRRE